MSTEELTYPLEIYQVTNDGKVKLDVVIGNPQGGIITVKKNGEPLVNKRRNKVEALSLGKGENLRRQRLTICAKVDDISDTTDDASLTYQLQGGNSPLNQTRPYKFVGSKKTVVFKIEIKFE